MQYTSYELLWLFFIYSVLGMGSRSSNCRSKTKKICEYWSLSLPMCPVYGFGAVLNAIFLAGSEIAPVFLAIGLVRCSALSGGSNRRSAGTIFHLKLVGLQ